MFLTLTLTLNPNPNLEHCGRGWPAPEVEEAEEVGPVAKVVEEVVLAWEGW